MRIRKAEVYDADFIAQVHVQAWRETYAGLIDDEYLRGLSVEKKAASWVQRLGGGEEIVFVLENEQAEVVGFISGGANRDGDAKAEGGLYAIYILRAYQRKGWGEKLFEEFRKEMKVRRYKSLSLWALEGNGAGKFYERMGGVKSGRKSSDIGGQDYWEVGYYWSVI